MTRQHHIVRNALLESGKYSLQKERNMLFFLICGIMLAALRQRRIVGFDTVGGVCLRRHIRALRRFHSNKISKENHFAGIASLTVGLGLLTASGWSNIFKQRSIGCRICWYWTQICWYCAKMCWYCTNICWYVYCSPHVQLS